MGVQERYQWRRSTGREKPSRRRRSRRKKRKSPGQTLTASRHFLPKDFLIRFGAQVKFVGCVARETKINGKSGTGKSGAILQPLKSVSPVMSNTVYILLIEWIAFESNAPDGFHKVDKTSTTFWQQLTNNFFRGGKS